MLHPFVLHHISHPPFLPTTTPRTRISSIGQPPMPSSPTLRNWVHASLQKMPLPASSLSLQRHYHPMVPRSQLDSSSRKLSSSLLLNPSDMNAEIDEEELDTLFDELGEVVLANPAPRRPAAEVDEDSECLAFAVALAAAANDVKAAEIKVLHVKPLIYWARFFVIATAFSRPQIDAVGKRMRDVALERFNKTTMGGDTKPNSWTLLDFGDVVVHIFHPEERAFYNLEEFYGNATLVDLPFTSQVVQ